MKICTTVLELTALCLGMTVLATFGSPEADDHPHLMLFGAVVALTGISLIVVSGLIQRRR